MLTGLDGLESRYYSLVEVELASAALVVATTIHNATGHDGLVLVPYRYSDEPKPSRSSSASEAPISALDNLANIRISD
eukprot:scaffold85522_cov20-Prasinocladus_malaysianus.AAC.1